MNYCLQHDCKYGYAIFSDAFKFRYDKFGSYRYNCKYLDVRVWDKKFLIHDSFNIDIYSIENVYSNKLDRTP
jgi:hypothetical protein